MKLVPLHEDDREQFILDLQWAFRYGAQIEFGMRDDRTEEGSSFLPKSIAVASERQRGVPSRHCIPRSAFGKPSLPISRSATSISMSTAADSISSSSGTSIIMAPPCPKRKVETGARTMRCSCSERSSNHEQILED